MARSSFGDASPDDDFGAGNLLFLLFLLLLYFLLFLLFLLFLPVFSLGCGGYIFV